MKTTQAPIGVSHATQAPIGVSHATQAPIGVSHATQAPIGVSHATQAPIGVSHATQAPIGVSHATQAPIGVSHATQAPIGVSHATQAPIARKMRCTCTPLLFVLCGALVCAVADNAQAAPGDKAADKKPAAAKTDKKAPDKQAKKKKAAPVASAGPAVSPDKLFARAKEAISKEEWSKAADLCFRFLATASKGAEKYEAAQLFLAVALHKLGFYHGAVEYYFQVANTRRSPALLPRAIRALEEIGLHKPIDEGLVLRDLIGDTDFGSSLPRDLADYVYYWQGMTNLRRGLHLWANERFHRIRRIGYYHYLAMYTASVRLLAPGKRKARKAAVENFAHLFGPLDLSSALESLRRRGESDSKLAYALKALINQDNQVRVHYSALPKKWDIELALLGFARISAETAILVKRSKETDEEELGRPFSYQVSIGGIPIYRRAPRYEKRAAMIKEVAKRREAVRKVLGKSRHALARLLYEQKRYAAAYDALGKIPGGTELSSQILLERAWAKYRAGDPHRAMGLLFALDAPVYKNLFAPEKYVLRGLIYRRFCHYRAAKIAARRFRLNYAKTLRAIRRGTALSRIRNVREAALRRGETFKLHLFYRSIVTEMRRLPDQKDWKKSGLFRQLARLYKSKRRQIRAKLLRELDFTAKEVGEDMLRTEEQVFLLEYEVGQAIFERVGESSGVAKIRKPASKVPVSSSRVYYRFNGEYWTDELPRYKFNIEDRCVE
jgi:hypothetical protein